MRTIQRTALACAICILGCSVFHGTAVAGGYKIEFTGPQGFSLEGYGDHGFDDESLFDMEGDGQKDIVVSRNYYLVDSIVFHAYDANGALKWAFSFTGVDDVSWQGFADVDCDGVREAIFEAWEYTTNARSIHVVDWETNVSETVLPGNLEAIVDFDGDGHMELVVEQGEEEQLTIVIWGADTCDGIFDTSSSPTPAVFRLAQNHPNPFNPSTLIEFKVERAGHVALSIYNVRGQHVRELVDDEMQTGEYTVDWDGRDDNGQSLSSGVYFYRLTSAGDSSTKKMVLLK